MKNKFMEVAIGEARSAARENEVPVGAAIFFKNELVASAHNKTISQNNPCAHAEVLAINRAFSKLGCYRLTECSLYVTLEPCAMCAGAIILARLGSVYFGTYDAKEGAFGGKIDLNKELGCKLNVYGGICETECCAILKRFFGYLS